MSVSKFIAGFVVGGAIGAIAGILLAPKSGEETRRLLSESAQDMARRADETAKQIKYKANDRGIPVFIADKYFPSSQLCSRCGFRQKISGSVYKCPICGLEIDRDLNAAYNLRDLAISW